MKIDLCRRKNDKNGEPIASSQNRTFEIPEDSKLGKYITKFRPSNLTQAEADILGMFYATADSEWLKDDRLKYQELLAEIKKLKG